MGNNEEWKRTVHRNNAPVQQESGNNRNNVTGGTEESGEQEWNKQTFGQTRNAQNGKKRGEGSVERESNGTTIEQRNQNNQLETSCGNESWSNGGMRHQNNL